jgi:hypothetical protein
VLAADDEPDDLDPAAAALSKYSPVGSLTALRAGGDMQDRQGSSVTASLRPCPTR